MQLTQIFIKLYPTASIMTDAPFICMIKLALHQSHTTESSYNYFARHSFQSSLLIICRFVIKRTILADLSRHHVLIFCTESSIKASCFIKQNFSIVRWWNYFLSDSILCNPVPMTSTAVMAHIAIHLAGKVILIRQTFAYTLGRAFLPYTTVKKNIFLSTTLSKIFIPNITLPLF